MNYTQKHIFELLALYSDIEKQREAWNGRLKEFYLSPTEFVAEWFDDIFRQNPDQILKEERISSEEWEIIRPFYEEFHEFLNDLKERGLDIEPDLTIHKEWIEISELAKKTMERLGDMGWEKGKNCEE